MKSYFGLFALAALVAVGATGCHHAARGGYNLPPETRLMEPGPGVGGPGPGVMFPPPGVGMDGMMGCGPGGMLGAPMEGVSQNVQVLFAKPEGMQVRWDVSGVGQYDSIPLITPGRQEFPQGGIYRLKLTNIRGREGVELYPTIEIGMATPRTEAFFDHSALPVQFTEEDFDQVLSGNFVTKVIYLPDPEFQELAQAGIDILVSTRLDPGMDPVAEADRRGSILAIIRLGNKDMERPGAGAPGGEVSPISYNAEGGVVPAGHHHPGLHGGQGFIYQPPCTMPHPYVAGVTVPQYGMPYSGTPIGLPGPPHIPLGVPAGLQEHTIKNHTHMNIPDPVDRMVINVKQRPGMSYPQPANRMWIKEDAIHPSLQYHQPHSVKYQEQPGCPPGAAMGGGEYCPPGP